MTIPFFKRSPFFAIVATVLIPLSASAQAIGDPVAGKAKAFACTGCHGLGGTKVAYPDVYKVPKLGGQHAAYIVAALKSYKGGERFNETMKAQAAALSEKDMADIAAYYAADKK
jgi:cytochrome c553